MYGIMVNNLKIQVGILLVLAISFVNVNPGYAQKYAELLQKTSLKQIRVTNESTAYFQAGQPLSEALKKLEKRFHVVFLYKSGLINGKTIKKTEIIPNHLEKAIKVIISQYALSYEELNPVTFGIFSTKKNITKQPDEAKQQKFAVKGKVTDASDGESLPGVNIVVQGTTIGTATGKKGNYSLLVPESADTLVFSYIGYTTQKVPIKGRSVINVQLHQQAYTGQQLVVIGYGTQKKVDVTGSVASVTGKIIKNAPVPNVTNALEGQLPGVFVNTRSGEPGNNSSNILIQGMGTLNNNSPLIVIDGIPNAASLGSLNPADIQSITVLKGAAAAIYGASSANGVILVTTKKGHIGKPVISYSGSYGFNQPTRIPSFVNGWQFMEWQNEKDKVYGRQPEYTQQQIDALKNGTYNPKQYGNTDWEHAILQMYAPMTTHRLEITGGTKTVDYFLSGQYLYQDGIFKKGATNYNQYNLRANINAHITHNLSMSLNLNGIQEIKHYSNYSGTSIFIEAMSKYPFLPVYFPNGDPSGSAAIVNPILEAQGKTGYNHQKYYTYNSNIGFTLNLPEIIKGLYLKGLAGFDNEQSNATVLNNQFNMYSYDPTTDTYINNKANEGPISLNQTFSNSLRKTFNLKLGYKNSFGMNNVTAFGSYEQSQYTYNDISAYRQGLLSDQIPELFAGADAQKNNNGSASHSAREDIFGRVTYNYQEKYLAQFTLRHDGSYRFPPNHRWGTFPSAEVGWRISQEPFFKNHVHFISDLKLRASWGKLGNDLINPYQYLNTYSFGSGYFLGPNSSHVRGFVPGVAPNPNITWEVADKKNIGFDATFFKGLISLSADYFVEMRKNILIYPNLEVPLYTGLTLPDENIGKVRNHGIDASFELQHASGDFNYDLSGNFTFARNKIVNIAESPNVPSYQKQTGHPMDSFIVYKTDGIYHNQQQINNSVHLAGAQPGDIRYVDVNGDGKITAADMVRIYESPIPEIQYGFTIGGGYKDLSLSLFWQGQAHAKQMILPGSINGMFVPPIWLYNNRWTASNPNATMPHAFDREDPINNQPSTFWMKNAWFLRLKTVRLSYHIPTRLASSLNLKNLSVYVSGQNLFVISAIQHYDPELNPYANNTGQYYPQVRIVQLGVSLSL